MQPARILLFSTKSRDCYRLFVFPQPPLPRLLHGFPSPATLVLQSPFLDLCSSQHFLSLHLGYVTHLLHDFQICTPIPDPSPTTLWIFPPGHPWGIAKSEYPNQLLFLLSCLSWWLRFHSVPQTPTRGAILDFCISPVSDT